MFSLSTRTTRAFSINLFSSQLRPQPIWVHKIIPPQGQDFAFSFDGLHEIPISSSCWGPSDRNTTIQCTTHFSQFCSICKFAEGASRCLIKIWKSTVSSISPWGTPPVIGLQSDFVLLITTFWAWQFSQFLDTSHGPFI